MAQYGYMAKIGADTSGLQKALKDINTDLRGIDRELNATNKSIKAANQAGINSAEMYKQKETELAAAIGKTKEKLDSLKSVEEQMKTALSNGSISAEQYREYQREISNTEAELRRYETELRNVQREEQNQNQISDDLREKFDGVSSAAKKVGADLLEFIKIIAGVSAAMGTAAAAVGKYSVGVGSSFESAMSSVKAYSGAAGEDLSALEEAAKEAGATTSKSATESANALGYMALAGWDTKEMLEGLNPILRASEAGNADLARTSDLVTDSMSAMGIKTSELSHYLDVCSAAQSKSNTSLTALLEAYIGCGGTMRNLNISVEESAAWLGILANRGKKASEAGTAFNSILVNLIGANSSASTALKELGVSAWDSEGNFIGLTETLKLLDNALANCTEQEKSFFEAKIGGKTQMDTLQALLSGLNDEYGELYNALNDCEGALGDTAVTMQDNLTGAITIMKSALEGVGVEIYDYLEEPLRSTVEAVTELLDNINDSIQNGELSGTLEKIGNKLGELLKKLAEFAADKGLPFLIDGVDKLTTVLGWFVDNSDVVISVLNGIGAGFVTWKIGTLVTDVVLLVKAIQAFSASAAAGSVASAALGTALNLIPFVAVATAIAAAGAALVSFILQTQKAELEAQKISESYVKAADDVIAANNDLIKSVTSAREAAEEALKTTDEQITKADEAKKRLDNLCDANGNLKDASLDVNEELQILNSTFGLQLTVIDGQIQGWRDLKTSYTDYCSALRAGAEAEARHQSYVDALAKLPEAEARVKQATHDWIAARQAVYDYKGANPEELKKLEAERDQAKITFEEAKSTLELTQQVIEQQEELIKESDINEQTRKRQGRYGGMREEAAENSNPDNNKKNETLEKLRKDSDAEIQAEKEALDEKLNKQDITLREYIEEYAKVLDNAKFKDTELYKEFGNDLAKQKAGLADTELQEEADKLDYKLKTHKINEDQYYAKLEAYLKANVNRDSVLWNKYNDELANHQKNAAQKKKSNGEIGKSSDSGGKTKSDESDKTDNEKDLDKDKKLAEDSAKADFDALKKSLDDEIITRQDFNNQYADLQKEWSKKGIDISEYTSKKISEINKSELEEFQKNLDSTIGSIEDKYKELSEAREQSASSMTSESLFTNVNTTDGERPIFDDLSKRAEEINKYAADYAKLSAMKDIPPDLLEEIKSMNFDDRRAVVAELLKMTDVNRNKYFSDYGKYKAAAKNAAVIETADMETEAAKYAKTALDGVLNDPDNAYTLGMSMAENYFRGFADAAAKSNVLSMLGVSNFINSSADNYRDRGGVIPLKTPIVINLGTETIKTTIYDIMTKNGLYGRENLRI